MPTAPKKAAKKAAGHHDPHKHARRTFEHLGRVQAIASLTQEEHETVAFLTKSADIAFHAQQYKASADLLRAAEHLSFASLNSSTTEQVSEELEATITDEFERLIDRAEEHAAHHSAPKAIQQLIARMTKQAWAALKRGSYRAALEFARGVEALVHVDGLDDLALPASPTQKRLQD